MKTTNLTLQVVGWLVVIGAMSAIRPAVIEAQLFNACYTNAGTVYRIDEPGLNTQCKNFNHTPFSWVLADAVTGTTNGFAVTGAFGTGSIPVSGAGVRIMWYPRKAAFRVGRAFGTQWDDGNIGDYSVAMGRNARAIGFASFAMGTNTTASGNSSTAMGASTTASGGVSTAMGRNASTNFKGGSFVYGDGTGGGTIINVQADDSFVVRAQRVFFGKAGNQVATAGRYIETSTGAYLSDGGMWTNASSRVFKENFRDVNGEAVLAKIAELPIQSWNYKVEDPSVRHLGPTSQDFQAAFALGDSDTAIGTVDIDGVNLLAVQALEKRTAELRAENARLRERLTKLEAMVQALVGQSRTK